MSLVTHTSAAQQSLMTSGTSHYGNTVMVIMVILIALARANSRLVVYSPRMTSSEFMELVQLCPDPAMLGCKLFAMIDSSDLANLSLQASKTMMIIVALFHLSMILCQHRIIRTSRSSN